jgi:predicted regulator of Ras-like GTPase activity (Roadblock/LC7/MglB family)
MDNDGPSSEVLAALGDLLSVRGVTVAVVADADGEPVAMLPETTKHATEIAGWAAVQLEAAEGLRRLVQDDFSILAESVPQRAGRAIISAVAGHALVVIFTDRESIGLVRQASKRAVEALEPVLRS